MKKHIAEVVNLNNLSWKVVEIIIETSDEIESNYSPGQFISVEVSSGQYRPYSICRLEKNKIALLVSIAHDGLGSNYFRRLTVGDKLTFIGPSGNFGLQKPLPDNLYFFGVGTGIAPLVSMFFKLKEDKYFGDIFLLQGFRHEHEIFFEDFFENIKENFNFDYKISVSQPQEEELLYEHGRITNLIDAIEFEENAQFYICGWADMVEEVKEKLISKGVSIQKIFFEKY